MSAEQWRPAESEHRPLYDKTADSLWRFSGRHSNQDGLCQFRLFERQGSIPLVIATALPESLPPIEEMYKYLFPEFARDRFQGKLEGEQPPYIPIVHRQTAEPDQQYGKAVFRSFAPRQVLVGDLYRLKLPTPEVVLDRFHYFKPQAIQAMIGRHEMKTDLLTRR